MYDIIIGRSKHDLERFGSEGTIFLGKHYVKMGQNMSLANSIFLDMLRSHVVFVCGKRGGGKSYTMGVIAEGLTELPEKIRSNLSIILLDTMGIYWTMKFPNRKDGRLLNEWGLAARACDITIYTPEGMHEDYKKRGIPTDFPFTIRPAELDSGDWALTFGLMPNDDMSVLIERVVGKLKKGPKAAEYSVEDIIREINQDDRAEKKTRDAALNRFMNALSWGLFYEKGTSIEEMAQPGRIVVIDLSCYSAMPNSWGVKSLVIGILSKKLFISREVARRKEEYKDIHKAMHYFSDDDSEKNEKPLVWLVVDEAHEFLPNDGKTAASDPLITILREGRQPGISLILASQQPGKIHTDVMTQADTVISHRLTAKIDIDALGTLMQSYMREDLNVMIDSLPRTTGAALVFDDTNERMYMMQVRPRFSWHGGEAPAAFKPEEKRFKFA